MSRFIYIVYNPLLTGVKIGISRDVDARIKQLNSASPVDFVLIKKYRVDNALDVERFLHQKLKPFHINREFFNLNIIEAASIVETLMMQFFIKKVNPSSSKVSDFKKDATVSIKINNEVLEALPSMGHKSLQKFLDEKIDLLFKIKITDNQLVYKNDE